MALILALMDFTGAVTMIALMKAITSDFGWRTKEQRWALTRRAMYAMVAIALFAKGTYRLDHPEQVIEPLEFWSQIGIVGYIVLFPFLRAIGWISQDRINR